MKYLPVLLAFFLLPVYGQNPRKIPTDLKVMGVIDFFEPEEILRVWRFPEGGAAFEELFEISRTGNSWTSYRFTFLLDEFRTNSELQSLRKKQKIELSKKYIMHFVNGKLLHRDTQPIDVNNYVISGICLCDLYRAEYRNGNQAHFFQFNLQEKGNTNISKIMLISFLNKVVSE